MRQCLGVLLAGGLARRMGGGDKPLLQIGGRPIIELAIERLAPQCAGLIINANGDPTRFAALGLPVVADSVPDFAGPLAGVLAGMEAAGGVADVVSAPADTPFLPTDLVERLYAARAAAGAEIAVAASGDRVHHAVALWPITLRDKLRHALVEEDLRKVSAFILRYPSVTVEWPIAPYDPFFNVNRPQDLARAESIMTEGK
jgi:molybdopterin-guanine dinucleotide biosynthesis protein A